MNKAKSKLRSQTGASITFALLLFLVCAVLSSVILVAATTAAGRMAGIAETDQRYYAVTSAAEAFKDLISDKTVTVLTIDDEELFFEMAPRDIVYQTQATSDTDKTLLKTIFETCTDSSPASLCLNALSSDDTGFSSAGVDISANFDGVDKLTLTMCSRRKKPSDPVYKLNMLFYVDVEEIDADRSSLSGSVNVKKTKTISWRMAGVQKTF